MPPVLQIQHTLAVKSKRLHDLLAVYDNEVEKLRKKTHLTTNDPSVKDNLINIDRVVDNIYREVSNIDIGNFLRY